MTQDLWLVLLIAGGALLILIPLIKIFLKPVKLVVKLFFNSLIGFILLWLINTFGGLMGFFLPINLTTVLVSGFLGVPGVVLLGALKYLVPH